MKIGNPLNLLIVDDEVGILQSLRITFQSEFQVLTAESGEEALSLIEKENEKIHIIICDDRMQGIQGHELLAILHEKYSHIVCILITGYFEQESLGVAVNEGRIFGFISKPWNPIELKAVVRKAGDYYRLQNQNKTLIRELKELNQELEKKVEARTEELNQKAEELEKSNQSLREVNSRMNTFVGIVSHDLRTPLGNLGALSQILRDEIPDQGKDLLKLMGEITDSSLEMVEKLLDLSALNSGEVKINLVESSFEVLAAKELQQVQFLVNKKEITLQNAVEANSPSVKMDPHRTGQVLINLLTNAIKFTPRLGTIVLKTTSQVEGLLIEVIDHGLGIPPDRINSLFTKFTKISTEGTEGEEGTGYGLPLSQRLMNLQNSSIQVSSELQKGSCFSFLLPWWQ